MFIRIQKYWNTQKMVIRIKSHQTSLGGILLIYSGFLIGHWSSLEIPFSAHIITYLLSNLMPPRQCYETWTDCLNSRRKKSHHIIKRDRILFYLTVWLYRSRIYSIVNRILPCQVMRPSFYASYCDYHQGNWKCFNSIHTKSKTLLHF